MRLMTVTTEVNYFRMTLASIAKVVMKVFIKKILNNTSPNKMKKTPLLHRIMWIYKQVMLIIFFCNLINSAANATNEVIRWYRGLY